MARPIFFRRNQVQASIFESCAELAGKNGVFAAEAPSNGPRARPIRHYRSDYIS